MEQKVEDLIAKSQVIKKDEYCQNGWDFKFQTSGIMTSDELDQLTDYLTMNIAPDVVFGKNLARLENKEHNFVLEFNPRDSLRFSNFKARETRIIKDQSELQHRSKEFNHINIIPKEVKIRQASIWKNKKVDPEIASEIKEIQQFSDCFFSTPYKGTVKTMNQDPKYERDYFKKEAETPISKEEVAENDYPYCIATDDKIPLENLTQENPIKWHSMVHQWEDELDDNGHTTSEFRFRVMGDCFFGLLRHYLRLDDVMVRIYDTRIYHDFKWNYILREFMVKEDSYENIMAKGFQFTPKWMIDPGQSHLIAPYVKETYNFKDKIYFCPPKN